jgi:hypothetical protein
MNDKPKWRIIGHRDGKVTLVLNDTTFQEAADIVELVESLEMVPNASKMVGSIPIPSELEK